MEHDKQDETTRDRAKEAAKDVAGEAKKTAKNIKSQVKQQAQETVEQVKHQAMSTVDESKGQVASQVESVAHAFQKAGDQLRQENQAQLADYTDRIADQVETVSGYLKDKSSRELVRDVDAFARRQPAVFLGGMLALGLIAARFLKSSERPDYDEYEYNGYYTEPQGLSSQSENSLTENSGLGERDATGTST